MSLFEDFYDLIVEQEDLEHFMVGLAIALELDENESDKLYDEIIDSGYSFNELVDMTEIKLDESTIEQRRHRARVETSAKRDLPAAAQKKHGASLSQKIKSAMIRKRYSYDKKTRRWKLDPKRKIDPGKVSAEYRQRRKSFKSGKAKRLTKMATVLRKGRKQGVMRKSMGSFNVRGGLKKAH